MNRSSPMPMNGRNSSGATEYPFSANIRMAACASIGSERTRTPSMSQVTPRSRCAGVGRALEDGDERAKASPPRDRRFQRRRGFDQSGLHEGPLHLAIEAGRQLGVEDRAVIAVGDDLDDRVAAQRLERLLQQRGRAFEVKRVEPARDDVELAGELGSKR